MSGFLMCSLCLRRFSISSNHVIRCALCHLLSYDLCVCTHRLKTNNLVCSPVHHLARPRQSTRNSLPEGNMMSACGEKLPSSMEGRVHMCVCAHSCCTRVGRRVYHNFVRGVVAPLLMCTRHACKCTTHLQPATLPPYLSCRVASSRTMKQYT